jgi:hypothetical protein
MWILALLMNLNLYAAQEAPCTQLEKNVLRKIYTENSDLDYVLISDKVLLKKYFNEFVIKDLQLPELQTWWRNVNSNLCDETVRNQKIHVCGTMFMTTYNTFISVVNSAKDKSSVPEVLKLATNKFKEYVEQVLKFPASYLYVLTALNLYNDFIKVGLIDSTHKKQLSDLLTETEKKNSELKKSLAGLTTSTECSIATKVHNEEVSIMNDVAQKFKKIID